ncbi:DUF3826 domain-containing protein [Aestuariibaculum sediminum]|uniref:DUF3826 domain-containing protein n=1 Tax=Aestuariibaculum sediminum TaxID=2770637 RepID=A0A8J6U706_9FLAO|nr:DUF3826 domain-containing protein [Aestuariibaculum sediminum]MBD0831268.1 DUF3826 domain-containing protein [Aestuariibaculum sediminum]
MLNLNKNILSKIGLILIVLTSYSASSQTESLWDKASGWVNQININNDDTKTTVTSIITSHLTAVRNWHNSHSINDVPEGINPITGEELTELDRSIIVDSALPDEVHSELMNGLRKHLNQTQIDFILDQYTSNRVEETMKKYKDILFYLKSYEQTELIKNLKKAREMAIDFKNEAQISAIFEIYNTKNIAFLKRKGRNWDRLYKSYNDRIGTQK